MKSIFFLAFLLLVLEKSSAQSTGTIAGKISNENSGESLNAVTISVDGSTKAVFSDRDGHYVLTIAPGTYSLIIESIGFSKKIVSDVLVKEDAVTELNISLHAQPTKMEGIVITSSARKETVNSVLAMQRNNASISDGISMEAIRKSPDRNIGEVLKRVSGTSIQDNKFVIVRGLSDRYNVSMINGAILPSTEPDRRTFSFDVLPSNLIDNILINKTASPDMPGDFSGGVVQILTKDIPFRSFFHVSGGLSHNSISTGNPLMIGLLKNSDYLGFDDGTRAFPSSFPSRGRYLNYSNDATPERRLIASRKMKNNYGDRYDGNALPGMNLQLNWGGRKEFRNSGTMGSVISFTYRNSQGIQPGVRKEYEGSGRENFAFSYVDTNYSFTTNMGLMANLAWKKGSNKIMLKNLANRLFDLNNLMREGANYDNLQYFRTTGTIATIKTLISSQLEGEHGSGETGKRIRWNLNYAFTAQEQPDYRVLPYSKNLDVADDKNSPYAVVLRDTYRFWSNLNDHAFGGNVNFSLPFEIMDQKQTFKGGLFAQYKLRDFSTRIFRNEAAGNTLNPGLSTLPPHLIFNDGNIYEEGFVLNEITNNSDKYDATSGLYAAYAMIDGKFFDRLRAVYGLRIERFNFNVNTGDFSNPNVNIKKNYLDFLPSLNLTYSITPAANLRFSASRTVSRPELREVANFSYFDFIRNAEIKGNGKLERSQNTNLDLRYEWFPRSGEIFSASVFYKHFKNPIEQTVVPGSAANSLRFTYENPDAARSYGVELEIRKKLDALATSGWLENLTLLFNGTYISSSVDFAETDNYWDPNRPMQGQSPWLVNAGLQYASNNNRYTFSALVNRIGERIMFVGSQDYADIYENGRTLVDIQAAMKVLKRKGELKLNVSDLLNQRSVFYQNVDGNNTYNASSDRVQWSSLFGRTISINFSYQIK